MVFLPVIPAKAGDLFIRLRGNSICGAILFMDPGLRRDDGSSSMTLFLSLLSSLLPLYGLIGLGFFAGRVLKADRQTIAHVLIFIFMPAVIFGFVAGLDLRPEYAALPVIVYILTALVTFAFLHIGRLVYGDGRANLLALCAGMGNTGYFGLPLVLLLFEERWVGVYMFMLLGVSLFEATLGYYIAARGAFTVRESLRKLARFPSLYAVFAGLAVNLSGTELPALFLTYWGYFKGCYVVLGMMLIGVALASARGMVLAPRFLGLAFAGKFLAWTVLAFGFIEIDRVFLGFFTPEIHALFMILAIVPPAANITAFAAQMDLRPEKAAATVLVGTVAALFYIPAVLVLGGFVH
ncbi:MAG: AEC family transporter [Alphaproteobacteria bacterium]|nr:AEC family transporter [Alphaproteobacteria bacterium]